LSWELAVQPAYTAIEHETGTILALTCGEGGWDPMFAASATSPKALTSLWNGIGTVPAEELLAVFLEVCGEAVRELLT
jgi:hypothetical protein